MDHLRRRQLGIRAAVHRRHPHLRQIADAGGRQHRVRLGLRANHCFLGHRAAHAVARLHRRRARHENQVLPWLLRHWRGHLLCNGPAPDLATVPSRLHSGDHRPQRLANVLRFDAHRRHLERAHGQGLLAWLRLGLHRLHRAVHLLHRADLRRPVALRLVHGGLHSRLIHHHRHLVGGIHHPAAYQLPPSALSRHP